jgi:prevent-host-death family protein
MSAAPDHSTPVVHATAGAVVGLFEAKTHLSDLVARASEGESITITRHGKPVARLVPVARPSSAELLRGRVAEIQRTLERVGFSTTHEEIDRSKREGRL